MGQNDININQNTNTSNQFYQTSKIKIDVEKIDIFEILKQQNSNNSSTAETQTNTVENNSDSEILDALEEAQNETQETNPNTKIKLSLEKINILEQGKETKNDLTLEEFLDSIEDEQTLKFYQQLYELYDYEDFNNRSDVPQYFQTVYTQPFARGTIRSSGCGITSLAMIASYLTGEEITPDMLTNGYRGDNPASAMHAGIKSLGLNLTTYEGWGVACQELNEDGKTNLDAALEAGKPVIARMNSGSLFTEGGHFIVIAGKTEDGKYIVNDPNIENYYKSYMVDGFTNGFTEEQITRGLCAIYVLET